MSRAAPEAATPAPPRRALTENLIIERVLRLDGRDDQERAFHLRPDAPIRAAMRGEVPRDAMSRPERIAALMWERGGIRA
jgi:hypothetical protein